MAIDRADTRDALSLRALFGRLDALSALQADWDSYGGLPPTARALGAASHLIIEAVAQGTDVPSGVMPFPNGGLQVIWERGRDEFQIDVGPDGGLGYLSVHRGDGEPRMTEADDVPLLQILTLIQQLPR